MFKIQLPDDSIVYVEKVPTPETQVLSEIESVYDWKKPPIQLTEMLFDSLQANGYFPEIVEDESGHTVAVSSLGSEEIDEYLAKEESGDREFTPMYGCFIHEDDIADPTPAAIVILMGGHSCYSPDGQHSEYSYDWALSGNMYMISYEDYKAISGNLYTPKGYRDAIAAQDPYEPLHNWTVQQLAYPEPVAAKEV